MTRRKSLESMEQALLLRREAILAALQGDMTLLQHLQSGGCDVVDFATDSAAEELSSQLVDMESKELADIDRALKRLKEQTYGVCEDCEKNIPLTRLIVLPYANLCIHCQRAAEESEDSGGWPTLDSPGYTVGDADPV